MSQEHFWFIDDEQQVRWAVRVSGGYAAPGTLPTTDTRIVFTSRHAQLSTSYPLDKDEQELTCYEVLELLGTAKLEFSQRRQAA
ncbi:MAG: hypothetical protein KY464_07330 [Gemmatimonadetes bacterium]|nr:hypothetical protein [Gemmatimonadota bacterium]